MGDYSKVFAYLPFLKDQSNQDEDPFFSMQTTILLKFVSECYETGLIHPDYRKILIGNHLINPKSIKTQIPSLSYEMLIALLSVIIIDDERIEGLLQANVQNGVVYEIVNAIQQIIEKELKTPSKNKLSS